MMDCCLQSIISFLTVPVGLFVFVALISQDAGPGLSKDFPLQFRILAKVRTPMLMFVVIPLSYGLYLYRTIRDIVRDFTENESSKSKEQLHQEHLDRIQIVIDQVQEWNARGRPKKLRMARPNWASMSTKLSSNKGRCELISSAHLNHILNIDTDNMTITCEPMVNMGQLTRKLCPRNLALQCQVEMESLTIGGLSLGFGIETNCHQFGLFQETVREYKLLMSTGEIVQVTPESDPELFYAIPWSHGSLGILLSVTVNLIRIQPYVKITYIPTYTPKQLQDELHKHCDLKTTTNTKDQKTLFVEATSYTKDKAVVQLAEFCPPPSTPEEKAKVNGINYFWKPFYYKHVETFVDKPTNKKNDDDYEWEIVPIKHFYHRFTRSIFWELEDMIPFSNHPIYRCLWGWLGAPEVSLLKLFQGPVVRRASVYAHVVQESIMPLSKVAEGLEKFDDWYGVYPLLVFPIRVVNRGNPGSGFLTPDPKYCDGGPNQNFGIWVDIGAYGPPRNIKLGKPWDPKVSVRAMEDWTRANGGWQALYTDVFQTKNEFRQMFNHTLWDQARIKYKCVDAFPDVYDKIKPEDGIVDLTDIIELEEKEKKQE